MSDSGRSTQYRSVVQSLQEQAPTSLQQQEGARRTLEALELKPK